MAPSIGLNRFSSSVRTSTASSNGTSSASLQSGISSVGVASSNSSQTTQPSRTQTSTTTGSSVTQNTPSPPSTRVNTQSSSSHLKSSTVQPTSTSSAGTQQSVPAVPDGSAQAAATVANTALSASAPIFDSTLAIFRDGFKDKLRRRVATTFQNTTLENLKQAIVDIQNDQKGTRTFRNLSRLEPFIEAMEQYGKIIEPFCNTSQFVPFIWGPLKFLLQIARAMIDAFNGLLEIYDEIAGFLPQFTQLEALCPDEENMKRILSQVYKDVLDIHWLALQYFQKSRWEKLFDATWQTHKSRFDGPISRMRRHYALAQTQTTISLVENLQDVDRNLEDYETLRRFGDVNRWLNAPDMDNKHAECRRLRADVPGTCDWLDGQDTFNEWIHPLYATIPALLWLNGQPGAGKTILASWVIDKIRALQHAPRPIVLYFYCKDGDDDRNNFEAIGRALLAQLLKQDESLLGDFYQKATKGGASHLASREVMEEMLKSALDECTLTYIVLDGIDECSREERKVIVKWFRQYIEDLPPRDPHGNTPDRVRCLFVSQNDHARKDFDGLPSVTVDQDTNERDIQQFCYHEAEKVQRQLALSDEETEELSDAVCLAAEGMFLFARLSWEILRKKSSLFDLRAEVQSYPTKIKSIDALYDRIISNIISPTADLDGDDAMMVLRWLSVAKRPFKLHEIQALKSMDLENGNVDFARQFRVDLKDLCGSLIEVSPDMTVDFVHKTAKDHMRKYLAANSITEIELTMANRCMTYLNFHSFRSGNVSVANAMDGEYAFMDYAALHWLSHVETALPMADNPDDDIRETLELFVEQHWNNPSVKFKITKKTMDTFARLGSSTKLEHIHQAVASTRKQLRYFGELRSGEHALELHLLVARVRKTLEDLSDKRISLNATDFDVKYGHNVYKCPRFSCHYFTNGFATLAEQKKHSDRHKRPYRCDDEPCHGYQVGFPEESQLNKHNTTSHPNAKLRNELFPTEEEVTASMKQLTVEVPTQPTESMPVEVVSEPESESEPEPVAPIRPRPEVEQVKRAKTKKEWTCKYCNRTFGKKWNWQSHLATHEGGENLSCDICGQVCARSSDLNRHKRVQHSKTKQFSCSHCKKSFGRRDVLQNHHRSRQGQICLAAINNRV